MNFVWNGACTERREPNPRKWRSIMSKRFMCLVLPVAAALAVAVPARAEEEKQTEEKTLTIEKVPAKVVETTERQVADGKILEIEREVKGGKEVFEIQYETSDGRTFELAISEDGELLSKQQD